MTRRELIEACLTFPDAYEDYPFDEGGAPDDVWTVMRHRGSRRCFAFIFQRDGLCVNLKCEPMESDLLRRAFRGVAPAYHMNKEHWNTVRADSDVPEAELLRLIGVSHTLTSAKRASAGRAV